MKTGIFITARLGSTRLKRKHLLQVSRYPMIYYLLSRISHEFRSEIQNHMAKLIIVTSDEPENREFENHIPESVDVFYGSKTNIPLRHLQASNEYTTDSMISIDGDDILCSVKGMRHVFKALEKGKSYVSTQGLPLGMNSMGYSRKFLKKSLENHMTKTLETGWGHIFDRNQLELINIPFEFQNELLRFTLDYEEDYDLFSRVIKHFGKEIMSIPDNEMVKYVIQNNLVEVTAPIANQYWTNFYQSRNKEKNRGVDE